MARGWIRVLDYTLRIRGEACGAASRMAWICRE